MLPGDAAGKTGDDASPGDAVEHRKFFRQAQRIVDGQQIAVDEKF